MPRKKKEVSEKELHSNAPWGGYINLTLNKQDSERLADMSDDIDVGNCLQDMVDHYYKIGLSYDPKRGYRATATGCMGSANAGKALSGYSGSTPENAIKSLYYRLAMMLEYEQYQEIQLNLEFG